MVEGSVENQKRGAFLRQEGLLLPKSPTLKLLESARRATGQTIPPGERVITGILDETSRDNLWVDKSLPDKPLRR
ncbi:MAG: hypothetical protein Q7S88_02300 [Candidatus Daviesbacteria bacterium]|nr:hypothetical protein [Candidatus Daviesbacteria bacterium]